ncbi:MAG: dihydrodipicolinate synthase family protein [Mangrovibacterium sp.]|nr:dihydrodipicolinate synthase family protein [Mangrovibacterium sp.]
MTTQKMENGFYPALGTPVTDEGKLIAESFIKEIGLMIDAGAKGLLCMGSMGNMASVRSREYPEVARQCVETVRQRLPVMVGVMDCSVSRVRDRIDALGALKIDGVVATAPFYYKVNTDGIVQFFTLLAKVSKYPVYIYDLPSVTQSPVTFGMMKALADVPNIKGIKTANLGLILEMRRSHFGTDDFSVFYSGLDLFDIAMQCGIGRNLDGMFTCTPVNSRKLDEDADPDNWEVKSTYLKNILDLRNLFLKENVFSAYSYAMELLGCPGNYQSDYDMPVSEKLKGELFHCMKGIGEL